MAQRRTDLIGSTVEDIVDRNNKCGGKKKKEDSKENDKV